MSLVFNMVGGDGGGGLSPNSAVIHVTAPVGSTISFSKGGVVAKVLGPEKSHINADDATMADWYYSVSSSNYGTWTVTATLDADEASSTVTVSNNKQYDVELAYGLYFFKNGKIVIQPDAHPYKADVAEANNFVSVKFAGSASTAYAVWKLTAALLGGKSYSSLVFVVHSWTPTSGFSGIGLGRNEVTWQNEVVQARPQGVTLPRIFTLDCSNVTLQDLYLFIRTGVREEALFDSVYFEE